MRRLVRLLAPFLLCLLAACQPARAALVFVGSYTPNGGAGISTYRLDLASGSLSLLKKSGELPNPSFLAIDPSRRYLLAVSESGEYLGQPGGAVSSYRIDAATGSLTLINSQPTRGASPCYVSVDPSGKWVLVANYSGGSLTVLPLDAEGRLGEPSALEQHHGSGPNPERQEAPHVHSVQVARGNPSLVLAADLGLDQVLLYDLDSARGSLAAHAIPSLALKPGSGPRHFAFHPSLPALYVLNELASSLSVFRFDAKQGSGEEIETVSLLPAGYSARNTSADVHLSPDGRFLYASNRGHDSLAIFAVDPASGKLTPQGQQPSGGKTPRNFAIDAGGRLLLAANQDSGTIVSFRIDAASGKLSPTGAVTEVEQPVCILIMSE